MKWQQMGFENLFVAIFCSIFALQLNQKPNN